MCPHLETARLTLDAHRQEDLAALQAMWSDPQIVRHISGNPSTRRESWSRLIGYRGLWPVLGYGYWCVRERGTGRVVGDVGFADFQRDAAPSISGVPEAGWVLAAWAHGQGYASEAVAAALAWLDAHTSHRRVVCLIDAENAASIRIAQKHDFQRDGTVALDGNAVPLWSRLRPPAGAPAVVPSTGAPASVPPGDAAPAAAPSARR